MNERNFLQDLKIVGTTLVSRSGEILEYTIPNMLKWCDWILLMQDNIDEETKNIIEKFKNKYPDRIRLAETGFSIATEKQETENGGLLRRFKSLQGPIRQTVLNYLYNLIDNGEKIDIVIWPDSDEIMSDFFPDILKEFWEHKEKQSLVMKPIRPYGDMNTILDRSMTGHGRCWKLGPKRLTAVPYRTLCNYRPLEKKDRMGCKYYLIHLCNLIPNKLDWRTKHWRRDIRDDWNLWKLTKSIQKLNPSEIREVLKREPDCTVEEYLRGGDKYTPVGIKNAEMAIFEASELLESMGITKYCLLFGNALFLYRDGQLSSKSDWDADMGMFAEELDKFDQQKVLDAGFSNIKIKSDIPKFIREDGTESEEKMTRTISFVKYGVRIDLDILYLSKDEQSRLILKGRKREKFVAAHPANWFNPMDKINFKGKDYYIPNHTDEYLESNYGKDWKTPIIEHRNWNRRACRKNYYEIK